ncbi:MAG: ribosome-associated translation inhibitor RaiA [bacterium]|nr:ribosome-associated translation inhibitor RaiA [bacterium]
MFKTNIKATNVKLTSEIREYLDKKLQSFSKLISPDDPTVILDIELGRTTSRHQSGNIFRAEINLNMKGANLRAESEKANLFLAIDEVRDEVLKELRRNKGRKIARFKRGARTIKKVISRRKTS